MAAPRVTVIIPTYNWSTVLPYSIGSVLDQTFTDFELLVIGDGCTDDSEAVVSAIADPRVRWINLSPRAGSQFGPNNEGLRQARGELIAYLGHDDLWLPHHLAAHVAAIDAGADLTWSIVAIVDADGSVSPMIRHARDAWRPPSSVMHRRRVAEQVGGWRDHRTLSIPPEHDLWRRSAAAGFAFACVPRMSVVKFPASARRGVYRERPSHEQAAWLQRVRAEPDIEAAELAMMLVAMEREARPWQYGRRLWRLFTRPDQWLAFLWRRKGSRIKATQRFKGVDDIR